MALDNIYGTAPPGSQAVRTGGAVNNKEDWASDFAITMAERWASNNFTPGPNTIWSNTIWNLAGVPLPSRDTRGSGMATATDYNNFYQLGMWLASGGWDQIPPTARYGLSDPTGLPDYQPPMSQAEIDQQRDDRAHANAVDILTRQQDFTRSENAADRQHEIDLATLQDEGATERAKIDAAARLQAAGISANAQIQSASISAGAQVQSAGIRAAADERIANIQAAVDREAIQSRERIATLDRAAQERIAGKQIASNEKIAAQEEAGRNRRFDLELGEDRRQFNTTLLVNLLDRGIELARNPVDWIAHQYWLQNINVPITAATLGSSASLYGAVPPTGPSQAGPVTGGPAAIDGDATLANAMTKVGGIPTQAAYVPVSEAVQQNPGGNGAVAVDPELTAQSTVAAIAQQVGGVEAIDQQLAQARATALRQIVGDNPALQQAVQAFSPQPPAVPQQAAPGQAPPVPQTSGGMQAPAPVAQPQAQPVPAQATQMAAPPVPVASNAASGTTTGVYTGQTASAPAGASPTPEQAPQGSALIQAIAQASGLPYEQVSRMIPPQLLASGASPDIIQNAPAVQFLNGGLPNGFSPFRTDDPSGTQFGQIQAFGIPIETRGQMANFGQFATAPVTQQQAVVGAIMAAGRDPNEWLREAQRVAPIGGYEPGAAGVRVF